MHWSGLILAKLGAPESLQKAQVQVSSNPLPQVFSEE
jgi:hypothetical protein